jgi:hypothetical protein
MKYAMINKHYIIAYISAIWITSSRALQPTAKTVSDWISHLLPGIPDSLLPLVYIVICILEGFHRKS